MTSCPSDEDLVRFVDGALSLEQTERLRAHVARCQSCLEREDALRELIADVKASVPAPVDVRAHARAVMGRLDLPTAAGEKPWRAWLFAGASSAAACALLVAFYVGTRSLPATGSWQPRGGPGHGAITRDVRVQPYAVQGGLSPLASGVTVDSATSLTAGFRNLGRAPVFLLLFAVDANHVVHWISPPYTRLEDNPVSTELPTTFEEQVLGTTAVLEDVARGPLRVVAVITSTPAHVSDVESLGVELNAGRLVRQLPGADVRETVVEMRTEGGTR